MNNNTIDDQTTVIQLTLISMAWFKCFSFIKNSRKRVKRSSEFIPYQEFSLPWPIIRYICSNGKSPTQLKLFSTCQQLKNLIAKIRGCQVDAVYFSRKINSHCLSITDGKIQIDLSYNNRRTINFSQAPRIKSLYFDLDYVDYNEMITYFQKFDYSIIEKINIWMQGKYLQKLDTDIFRLMFVSSLTVLLFGDFIKFGNEDMLNIALTEIPNLKKLRMRWQDGITNLSTASLIQRKTKLVYFDLNYVKAGITPAELSKFAAAQMLNASETDLHVLSLSKGAMRTCKCDEQEINDTFSKTFKDAIFFFNILFICDHP